MGRRARCTYGCSVFLTLSREYSTVDRDTPRDDSPRTIDIDPPVHVESYRSHVSLSWTALGVERFVAALRTAEAVPPTATLTVDATDTAGRYRTTLAEIETTADRIKYVRVDPSPLWTLSWERRTDPVVSLAGSPSAPACRRFHTATTSCNEWSSACRDALVRALSTAD